MDPQTKLENNYHQNKLKFHKILILAPYVSTGAQHLEKGGENCVQKWQIYGKFLKISEMTQDDSRWLQGGSGSFLDHQSSIKNVPIWRFDSVPKTPPRSHMNPQNHHKIHKSLVLAHNIHKDCPLGVARDFSDIYGAKHSPPAWSMGGPKGDFWGLAQKGV